MMCRSKWFTIPFVSSVISIAVICAPESWKVKMINWSGWDLMIGQMTDHWTANDWFRHFQSWTIQFRQTMKDSDGRHFRNLNMIDCSEFYKDENNEHWNHLLVNCVVLVCFYRGCRISWPQTNLFSAILI
jgi:hypothetical protein